MLKFAEMETSELKKELLKREKKILKLQYNPHFDEVIEEISFIKKEIEKRNGEA